MCAMNNVLSQCEEGCLTCDTEKDLCLFCDIKSGYQTLRGRCIKAQQENCAIQNHKGNCILCDKGYFVDSFTLTCVVSALAGTVDNCEEYVVDNECYQCESGFYLTTKNTCIEVTTPIDNCYKYASESLCSVCNSGYLLSITYDSCTAAPSVDSCASFTPLRCSTCDDGYQRNKNNYLYELLSFKSQRNLRLLEERVILDLATNYTQAFNVCQAEIVENCVSHDEFNTCAVCDTGYFLKKGLCVSYPDPKIYNCVAYSAVDTCVECLQGYYLESSDTCTKVEYVADCVTYDATANQTLCLECQQDYYLGEENQCSERTGESDIDNCAELNIYDETCQQCREDYQLTTDNKACLPAIDHCSSYTTSDENTLSLECVACVNGYYYDIDQDICVQGTIEKCEVYYQNSNSCQTCKNRYYLNGGLCKEHRDLTFCENYSNSLQNACTTCNNVSVVFTRSNACLAVQEIDNCSVYDSVTSCSLCEDGFYVNNDSRCSLIDSSEFCLQKDGSDCIKCLPNYILQDGLCVLPLHHQIRNCGEYNLNGLVSYEEFECQYCKENFLPVNYQDTYVCYENDYLINQLGVSVDLNCAQYKTINNSITCVSCVEGYLLYGGACHQGSACPNNYTLLLQQIQLVDQSGDGQYDSFYVNGINQCVSSFNNCAIASPDLNQDLSTINYSCVECLEDYLPIYEFTGDTVLSKSPQEVGDYPKLNPLSYQPSRVCESEINARVLGEKDDSENFIPDCDLYYRLTGFGVGCLRCEQGQTGIVVNAIHNCTVYDSLTSCSQCAQGYYPITNYRCQRVTPVLNCQVYENNTVNGNCQECTENYFLNAGVCNLRQNFTSHCDEYERDSEECTQCLTDYVLVSNGVIVKCIKEIQGCASYDFATETCLICEVNHYKVNNLCYQGEVTHCAEYEYNPLQDVINVCTLCENGYYLTVDNTCLAQPTISDCDTYSQERGYCSQCSDNNFLFLVTNQCIPAIDIAHCEVYKSVESCQQCADGYQPVNYGQRCFQIPTSKHCTVWGELTSGLSHDEDNCLECESGYLLIDKKCRDWFKGVTDYCVQTNTRADGLRKYAQCQFCDILNDYYRPMDVSGVYGICTESTLLEEYFEEQLIDNCKNYTFDTTSEQLVCLECNDNYYLYSYGTNPQQCLTQQECYDQQSDTYFYLVANKYSTKTATSATFTFTNTAAKVCTYATAASTEYLAYDKYCLQSQAVLGNSYLTSTDNLTYQCVDCPYSQKPYKVITGSATVITAPAVNALTITDKDYVIDSCKSRDDIVSQTVLGSVSTDGLIDNCAFYYFDTPYYICVQCAVGYRGLVKYDSTSTKNYIDQCEEFTSCNSTVDNVNVLGNRFKADTQYFASTYNTVNFFELNTYFAQCKECSTSTDILVSVINSSGFITQYSTATGAVTTTAGNEGYNMACVTSGGTFSTYTISPTSNCSKVILDVQAGAYFCAACYKGYYPTYDSSDKHKVTQCTAYSHCQTNNYDNICQQCSSGYYFLYDGTANTINYEADCVNASTVANCYTMTSSGTCMYCEKGYTLTTISGAQVCSKIQPARCDGKVHNFTTLSNNLVYYQNYVLNSSQKYCSACEAGMNNVLNYNEMITYLKDNNFAPQFVTYDKTCVLTDQTTYNDVKPVPASSYTYCDNVYAYSLLSSDPTNMDIYCRTCTASGVITLDGKCVAAVDNANCLVATDESSNFCNQCDTGYISVAGVCQAESTLDANCAEFADSSFVTGSSCIECNDYYYLEARIEDGSYVTECIDYYNGDDPSTTTLPIKNCVKFNSDDLDRLYCTECEPTFALIILEGDDQDDEAGYNRKCIDVSAQMTAINCAAISLNPQKKGQLTCTQCANDDQYYMKNKSQTNGDSLNTCVNWAEDANCETYSIDTVLERVSQSVTFNYNYLPKYSSLVCEQCADGYYMDQAQNLCVVRANTYNGNCIEYQPQQDFCRFCDENYFLSSDLLTCVPAPIIQPSLGHIFSCKDMEECNTEVNYAGLDVTISSMVSCHECKLPNQIPFLAVSGDTTYFTINNLKAYNLTINAPFSTIYAGGEGGRSVFCAEAVYGTFDIASNDWAFPTNCAIGILNVDSVADATSSASTTNVDRDAMAVFCGACEPGYYPTYGTDTLGNDIDYMIGSCTAITNCQESKAFNSCTQCDTGYAFAYVSGEVDYTSCVQIPNGTPTNKDCYSYDAINSVCVYCNEGTYLNADNFCERITPPKCLVDHFQFKSIYDINNLSTGLYLNQRGAGCTICEEGYSAFYQPDYYWVCTDSQILQQQLLPANTLYLLHCQNYYVDDNVLKCQECYSGYIPINGTGECTAQVANLVNCSVAQDSSFCLTCYDDYVLVNSVCTAKSINNCSEYYYTTSSLAQVCNECEEGYYLEANQCIQGAVENCLSFETRIVCNECIQGYQLVKRNDGVSYCYPIDESLNCREFDSTNFQAANLACTECSSNHFIITEDTEDFFNTHCMRFNEVNNCISYNIQPALGDSSFACNECTEQFYLSSNECVKRVNMPDLCEEYNITADRCSSCEDGYFPSTDGSECIEYPTGIEGCEIYTSKYLCSQCETLKYLSGEYCLAVPTEYLIDNCVYYSDKYTCNTCDSGYLLVDSICQEIVAQNCATYESVNACATCSGTYGFEEDNSIKSCVSTGVSNCDVVNPVPDANLTNGYACIFCSSGYYLVDSACVQVDTEITYCVDYDSNTTCSRCQKGTALSVDGTSCLLNSQVMTYLDMNCSETYVLSEPACNSCLPGFVFEEGSCTACETDSTSCYNCDPQDKTKCLMCKSGYRMTALNVCVKEESDIDLDTINEIPNEAESVGIWTLLLLQLITLLL